MACAESGKMFDGELWVGTLCGSITGHCQCISQKAKGKNKKWKTIVEGGFLLIKRRNGGERD